LVRAALAVECEDVAVRPESAGHWPSTARPAECRHAFSDARVSMLAAKSRRFAEGHVRLRPRNDTLGGAKIEKPPVQQTLEKA
jgi:hypothetical protein